MNFSELIVFYSIMSYILFTIGKKFYLARLILTYEQIDKIINPRLFALVNEIKKLSTNLKFIIFVSDSTDSSKNIFLGNLSYRLFKPNCIIIDRYTLYRILKDKNSIQQLSFYIHSEALFRKPTLSSNIFVVISFIIENVLERVKIMSIIINQYYRFKRIYIDNKLMEKYSPDCMISLLSNLWFVQIDKIKLYELEERYKFIQRKFNETSGFFTTLIKIVSYDLNALSRMQQIIKKTTKNNKTTETIPYITD